ncbi:1-(5-phosphoribosyl)-5-[(5-phosphoribosylamino)methylideneamino] imidazole-4-carboxamide isomerase [Luteimonas cucumeris]|uniref:1-(5-phosphoribosyl)-5-[(5-phosphoribosylamino)methylideneamino] imidazole-4-carboxamide isomerase n=1 Tax=Luteimonas cucumeris TaxID=985012 RepID=A0A562L7G3_9GAMM|nr:1-(5-phosphoribosyl)-5-[(5-phosphoribosylamino)methylideneamino] imidazole-4-carboxamide isomerase [Luteimonas cucumeris]TWI03612.1 1-(5-phosphoribosyl)-5-[(5-phosphoribosylamino)methylideneamino] imidazole-4-carboxamide isomerase [Luteimonas cucumeris]
MIPPPPCATFQVYPAIDVRAGRVVRLAQGDYARETRYDDDPLALATRYAAAGARWLHLVDLDAARAGGYTLQALLTRIKGDTGLSVQTGGGVRSETDVERLLELGADRVVIGSLSVSAPARIAAWIGRYGSANLTIALDARCAPDGRWFPATHGWTRQGRRTLSTLVRFYTRSGLQHLLCTDIARDGMLSGPNLQLYALLRQWAPQIELQASGGVRGIEDVRGAREAGCSGIVLGKALLEGRMDLSQALSC